MKSFQFIGAQQYPDFLGCLVVSSVDSPHERRNLSHIFMFIEQASGNALCSVLN